MMNHAQMAHMAQATTPYDSNDEPRELSKINQNLNEIRGRFSQLEDRLCVLNEHLFGHSLGKMEVDGRVVAQPAPAATPMLQRVGDNIESIFSLITAMENQIERLERL